MTDKTTELIARAKASIEHAASSATPSQAERIRAGESDDERLALLVALTDALEAEHQRAESAIGQADRMQAAALLAADEQGRIADERDALRAAIQEALAVELRSDQMPYRAWPMFQDDVRRILSRAIDTKEESNG